MDEIDLTDIVRAIIRRRRMVAGIALAAALIAFIAARLMPQVYRGKAVLLFPQVRQTSASGLLSQITGLPPIAGLGLSTMSGPGMYAEILRSRTLGEQVARDLKLTDVDVDYEVLQKQLDITVTKDGGMEVCCYAPTSWVKGGKLPWLDERLPDAPVRQKAAYLAAEITNSYLRRLEEFDRRHAVTIGRHQREFLEREVEKTGEQLFDAEENLRRFKEGHPSLPAPEMASQQAEQLIGLRTKQIEAETEIGEAEQSIEEARGVVEDQEIIQTASRVVQENPVISQLKTQLAQAEVRRAQLLENLTEKHPAVVAVEQEIAKTEEKIGQEVPKVTQSEMLQLNPVRQALVQQLATLEIKKGGVQARLEALREAMSRVERELSEVAKDQMRYLRLVREVKALEMVYTSLRTELSQARVAEAKDPEGFTVLDWAAPEKKRFRPRIKLTVAAAFVLGLMVGGFAAMAQEARRPRKVAHDA